MSVKLARSAGLISVATMASRVLGVAREMVLAAFFGASGGIEMDAFNVAFRIPNLLRDLFAEGAMTAAFVPTFTRTLTTEGREAAWRLGNLVINALLVITGFIVLIGIVFAAPITHAFAPWFADTPGKLELTTELTRIMLPFLATVAVAVAMMGMLNSLRRFFIPAFSPAMFNVATILCAFTLVPVMPRVGLRPIVAIALGTILGGIGQIALQWPVLRGEGFRYQPIIDFKDPKLLEVLRLMGPGTLGLAAVQINVFVNTYLATSQQQGSVSWLNYAFRLMYLPIGLFGVSVATASTPAVSRLVASREFDRVRATIAHAIGLMMLLNVPATFGLIVLAEPIVRVIFEHGSFTATDTANTASALRFYAAGLLGYSVVRIVSPTFYALGQSRTPVMVSMASVLVNVMLNLALVRVLGYRGLALGTSITALLNASAQLWLLRRRLSGIDGRTIAASFVRVLLASLVMAVMAWGADRMLLQWLPGDTLPMQALRLALVIALSVGALAAAAAALGIPELAEAIAMVRRRFRRQSGE